MNMFVPDTWASQRSIIELPDFFWPGMKTAVSRFVRSCHVCQLGGKPNQTIPLAPLQPIPVFGKTFERLIIDCVQVQEGTFKLQVDASVLALGQCCCKKTRRELNTQYATFRRNSPGAR